MNIFVKAIQLTATEIKDQLWGEKGREARNFFIFHTLNIIWFFGEMLSTILFYPFLMIWLVTIVFWFIPEYRWFAFVLTLGYVFAFIAMRIEAKRYYYKQEEIDVVIGDIKRKIPVTTKHCKYSDYRVKVFL